MKIFHDFNREWISVFLSMCMWHTVGSEVYESIQWSPFNPKFHFSDDNFKNDLAFYTQIASPGSQINIICPNVATILTNLTQYPLRDNLHENLWIVGKEEFYSCKINSSKTSSRLVQICNRPESLHYYTVHFVPQNTFLSLHPGLIGSVYFLSTSNGTKHSLNNTAGGHCMDTTNGISMRIQFKVCEINSTEPSCRHHSQSGVNKNKDIKTCKNTTITEVAFEKQISQEHFWEIFAIILGVLLIVSFIVHCICIICYCVRKNRNFSRQLSHHSQKGSNEPLKSLILDAHKKPKHGRKSAAL